MASRVLPLLFILIAAFLSVGGALADPPAAASPPAVSSAMVEPFTVGGVDVDVTAVSANAAKQQAISQASRQAFQTLLERLTAPSDRSRLPKVDGADYVSYYDVDQERRSSVRYIATLTIHFNAPSVRQLLKANNIAVVIRIFHPVVIVPVYKAGGGAALWDDPNPWRAQWMQPGLTAQAALVVPGDGALPTVDQALNADGPSLNALAARFHASQVLVMIAEVSGDGHKVEVSTLAAPGSVKPALESQSYTVNSGEAIDQTLARAARDMARALDMASAQTANQQSAMAQGAAAGNGDDSLWTLVNINGLEDWVGIRERLNRGAGVVRSWELLSLTRAQAAVILHLGTGGEDQARAALAQAGLELTPSDGNWTLRTLGLKR